MTILRTLPVLALLSCASPAPAPAPPAPEPLPAPLPEPAPAPEPAAPAFRFDAAPLSEADRAAMVGVTWREGCPVPLEDLRRVDLVHVGFDGAVHEGVLVVHADAVEPLRAAFAAAFEEGFPLERVEPAHRYGGDDDASMAANNTSSFNCRPVTGGKGWSEHSYGHAIDVNPVQNPYVRGGKVLPPAAAPYVDRDDLRPGMLTADSALVRVLREAGWGWGGAWTSMKDYQHLSATGR